MKDNRKKLEEWRKKGFVKSEDAKREIDIITQRLGDEVQEQESTIQKLIRERREKGLITSFTVNQLKFT